MQRAEERRGGCKSYVGEREMILVGCKQEENFYIIIIDQQLTVYGEKGLGFFVFCSSLLSGTITNERNIPQLTTLQASTLRLQLHSMVQ